MLILSDDKSPYAQFSGLIAAIEQDRDRVKRLRNLLIEKHGEAKARTLVAYKLFSTEIGTYNSVISLICTTDIMVNKVSVQHIKHIHANTPNEEGAEFILKDNKALESFLRLHATFGVVTIWEACIEHGMSFRQCDDPSCLPA